MPGASRRSSSSQARMPISTDGFRCGWIRRPSAWRTSTWPARMSLYDIPVTTLDGEVITLERYRGRALLIVNVASRCGFTPQYRGLETLYRRYQDRLVVLGFPCNQFGRQEPGTEAEIRTFCSDHYAVTFPMFAK